MSLAYWAMDDGSISGKGFHFNTYGFSLEEVELLFKVFNDKFGIFTSLHSHNGKYRIYIKAQSMKLFKSLVKPYFHSSMLYKLKD